MIDDERPDAGNGPEQGEPEPQEADAPNEGATGDVDPAEVEDAEPSPEAAAGDDAPNEGATGDAEPPAGEGEPPAAEAEPPSGEGDPPAADAEPPAADAEAPAEDGEPPAADAEPAPADAEPPAAEDAEPAPGDDEAAGEDRPRREKRRRDGEPEKKEDVVPGAHLEPDLVLEEARRDAEGDEYADRYAAAEEGEPAATEGDAEPAAAEAPGERAAPRSALDLAADARYLATGKRKTSVARVILKPGDGAYTVNGRSLEDYFPRAALQKAARQPLQTAGFEKRMDVTAKIHGGGISAQAGALRHGVARALVEADPSLRVELKRRGYLSRDARAKERKKAGLKKARKRPQFSKR